MAHRRYDIPPQAELDREAVKKHKHVMAMLQAREDEIEANAKAEEADFEEQAELMDRDWRAQMERNKGLREAYEGLLGSGVLEEEDGMGEGIMGREIQDEDDEWSRDGSSVSSVEMGEVDEDNEMMDVGREGEGAADGVGEDSSDGHGWGLSDGSSSSESE